MIDREPGRGLFFKRRPRIFAASVVMVAAAVIRKIVMPKNVFCFLAPQLNSPLHSTPSNGKKVFDLIRLRDEVNVGNRDRWMKIIEKKREREKNGKVNKVISLLALALRRRFLLDYFLVVQCKRPTWEMKENEQQSFFSAFLNPFNIVKYFSKEWFLNINDFSRNENNDIWM